MLFFGLLQISSSGSRIQNCVFFVFSAQPCKSFCQLSLLVMFGHLNFWFPDWDGASYQLHVVRQSEPHGLSRLGVLSITGPERVGRDFWISLFLGKDFDLVEPNDFICCICICTRPCYLSGSCTSATVWFNMTLALFSCVYLDESIFCFHTNLNVYILRGV